MTRIPDFATIDFAEPVAGGAPAGATPWMTPEGIAVKPAYVAGDLDGIDFLDTQPWTVRQYAGFSTAEDSNAFYRRNLAAGQKGLSVSWFVAHRVQRPFLF